MTTDRIRRVSKVAYAVSSVVFLVAILSVFPAVVQQLPHQLSASAALAVLLAAAALVVTYLLLAALGVLDQPVSLGRFVPDAWESVLASGVIVAIAWLPLVRIISTDTSSLRLAGPVVATFTIMLTLHRAYRVRSHRSPGTPAPESRVP